MMFIYILNLGNLEVYYSAFGNSFIKGQNIWVCKTYTHTHTEGEGGGGGVMMLVSSALCSSVSVKL